MINLKIVDGIRSYIDDNETRIVIVKNKINIINYIDIGHFDSNKIVVKLKKNNISVNGKNLVVSKLINDEILILVNLII